MENQIFTQEQVDEEILKVLEWLRNDGSYGVTVHKSWYWNIPQCFRTSKQILNSYKSSKP